MSEVLRVRRGRTAAVALAAIVLALSALATALAGPSPLRARVDVPWLALVPAYVLATRLNLEFTRRGDSINVTLVQLPLVLGLTLVTPLAHLGARLTASVIESASKRHEPLKAFVNLSLNALELALAATVVGVVADLDEPGPTLWLALAGGLLLAEAATHLLMHVVFRLLGRPVTVRDLQQPLLQGLFTSAVFTAVGILTVSAAWTDRWTLLVVAGLFGGLALAYRVHRRLAAQQQATEDMYSFVKDLGPIDVDQPEALQVLERVRLLLHARHLDLTTLDSGGRAAVRLSVHEGGEPEVTHAPDGALVRAAALASDRMTSPVLLEGSVRGLLTARHRLGAERGFDMRDLRLLETVGAELATALDRGRLLTDLGLAATRDPLTGLPNLRATAAQLDDLLARGDVLLAAVAVDSFREVNDTLGHLVGDELLCEVAQRLSRAAPSAVIGRIGGGRFAVAVPSADVGSDAALFGLGLRSQVEGGVQIGAIGTHVRLSVGCVRGPDHGPDAATLLRRAETAMYSARHAHGGPVLWEPAYEVQGQRRLAVVMALREALSSGAVGVGYQPKVSASTGRVTGVEALARWTHPALGSISPDEFVPLAEASGLMGALTQSVLRQSLTACKGWQRRGGHVGVAVNVSADTVLDASFVTDVAEVLTSVDVDPGLLTLELTEGVVVEDPHLAAERMNELRRLGVRLSIDDFGTGYSSLTYLKGLPIDEVKIDKGFVAGLVDDAGDQAVVRAVVDIAHTLGMRVVAEGVEQEDQQQLLRRLGVDEVQGYLYARPMPALGMAAWIRRHEAVVPG